MRRALLATYSYAEFVGTALAFLPLMAVSAIRHREDLTRRHQGRWMRRFGKLTSQLTPLWRFEVEGVAPADVKTRPYVVVSNHESNADPFLLSHLPWDMRWIAKQELFRQPLTGWLLTLGGDIPLRRGERESVVEMLAECRATLRAGMSVMVFPEGTRSPDGELLPFKDGAFQLAVECGVPVLPLALHGTRDCMQKGSFLLHEAHAVVRILEPVETQGMTLDDVATLRDTCRDRIAASARELRSRRAP
ncbi:MAG: 1-acyl-sn-glycerol-3-phosphate acyltransferase [Polyangiaceae bacterium]|nr:1-acyl-sn-glycerol-3-phosphate acyltransferase [Polyangiaceae bacterium]